MSLLKNAQASPSRVYAIYSLILQMPDKRIEMDLLKRLLAPQAFASKDRNETDFIGATIPEVITLGLIHQESAGILSISDQVPSELLLSDSVDVALPNAIREKIMSQANDENNNNEDLVKVIAWYMSQNPYKAPGNWASVEESLLKQLNTKLDCSSDARYGQFEDWVMYLGFASRIQKYLLPDPSHVIRYYLPTLFRDKRTHNIDTIIKRLAEICPVFERGRYREWLTQQFGVENLREGQLSQVTSFAFMRLHDEKLIRLEKKSDADVYLFTENQETYRYSEITWCAQEANH
ncbi:hypothetical protein EDM56_02145 [Brevibacillus fluminis]|uniref:Uncharacterized protein n=1 Tax=Brevibacillus fluminis TaxID=511487 RepID=A0A3M8DWM9_9BACL|nr:protein DpdG [Brevibacillus fluminis]RNB92518.1 hypothetical protein EDM56_02145 [Brevibacillus fluminis]